ncbi:hypothetical protein [Edwardsiella piscicida]|uniref:Immunity protein n=1 Tax=Edwardsiella piscicida TaxID=1263550 RepID=A0AAQ3H5H5_EDWPI|nr:hypothetical protein [Edwardsiella piscicida]ARD17543.1 hypothetical protein BXA22_03890 [Edwardsiella piscicida]EKS7765503.1 hypothetical protein [Edwardsiella piscicida]EKS7812386.1 hypothetical protein [Edwardsiella piscicida]QHR96391.1 hypothetical protein GT752_14930 [Edwardsiella piscicida]UBU79976.1 hypothetical protein A9797_17755 [Edwardsiella piscicida]
MKIRTVGVKLNFVLICYCVLILIGVALLACLCAAILVFLKNGKFIFSWEDDVLYSVKAGIATGIPTGIGIWFMSWIKARKEKRSPSKE